MSKKNSSGWTTTSPIELDIRVGLDEQTPPPAPTINGTPIAEAFDLDHPAGLAPSLALSR